MAEWKIKRKCSHSNPKKRKPTDTGIIQRNLLVKGLQSTDRSISRTSSCKLRPAKFNLEIK